MEAKFLKELFEQVRLAWRDHYGGHPDHPNQFFDIESQTWVDIPNYTNLYEWRK